MKTPIRAETKPQRSFVPIASFEFESFEVRVQRVTRHRPLSIGLNFRKVNVRRALRQFKTVARPRDAVRLTKILLPSPSHQGLGWMSLHLWARPVDQTAALSSRQFHPTNSLFTEAREPEQIARLSHKLK